LNPKNTNPQRINNELREQAEGYNWSGINFPTSWKDIDKFESQNGTISVNVFGYEAEIYPLRISKNACKPGRGEPVNLLLISNAEKQHYCVIKNRSRLFATQTSKTDHTREFCLRCLNGFPSKESLDKHMDYCKEQETVKRQFPEAGSKQSKLYYKNHYKSMNVPIVVIADFESFTKPIDTCQPNPKLSYTMQYQEHIPSSFCYYIECVDDTIYSRAPVSYVAKSEDDDVAKIVLDSLVKDVEDIYKRFLKKPKKMIFTAIEAEIFNNSTSCHICGGELGVDKVRDHCHLTGKFRGAAHNECNVRYRVPRFIPVFFHNLSRYDAHLFYKEASLY